MQKFDRCGARQKTWVFVAAWAAVGGGVMLGWSAPFATAQQPAYLEGKPLWEESNREHQQPLRQRESLVREILNGRQPFEGANKDAFDEYFRRHIFPQMTVIAELGQLDARRLNFFRQNFQLAPNMPAPIHDYLVNLTFSVMQTIVTGTPSGQFHPAVRYNAMLIIGDLNQQEASGFGANRVPPTPLDKSLVFMLAQLNDPKQIDPVRMAALVGILRHAQIIRVQRLLNLGPPANDPQLQARIARIRQAVQPIAEQKDPPEDRSLDGHTWMRRRALDVLIALNDPNSSVGSLLEEIVADRSAPLSLRCTAAEALGKMTVAGQQLSNPLKTAENVTALAIDVCQLELKWWDDEKVREAERKLLRQGGGGSMGYGGDYSGAEGGYGYGSDMSYTGGTSEYMSDASGYGYPGTMGTKVPEKKKVEPRLDKTQRRIKDCMYYVKLALDGNPSFSKPKPTTAKPGEEPPAQPEGGILARAAGPDKARVRAMANAVVETFLLVDSVDVQREKMLQDLRTQLEKLQSFVAADDAAGAGIPSGSGPPSGSGAPPAGVGPSASGPPSGAVPSGPPSGAAPSGPPVGAAPSGPPNAAAPNGPPANAPAPRTPPGNAPAANAPPGP